MDCFQFEKVTQNSSWSVKFACLIAVVHSKIVQERGAKRRHHKATLVFLVWICLAFEASTLQNVDSKQQTAVAWQNQSELVVGQKV